MMLTEIITVYCKNHTKPINKKCNIIEYYTNRVHTTPLKG
jgi:hypothetical protein